MRSLDFIAFSLLALLPPIEDLKKEAKYFRETYDKLKKEQRIVYCHMDPQTYNTIYDKSTGM